jgi:hypothetical protein
MANTKELTPLEQYKITTQTKNQVRRPLPFDKYLDQANAKPDKGITFETNAFDRSLFKHLAHEREMTMRDVIRQLAREAALREILGDTRKTG